MNPSINQDSKTGKIKVSDDFVKAYRLFNIISIKDVFDTLSRAEKILLYLLVVDKHSDFNQTSLLNFSLDRDIVDLIHKLTSEGPQGVSDVDIMYLTNITGFDYISVDSIVDGRGRKLPKPLLEDSEIQAMKRDLNIEKILED